MRTEINLRQKLMKINLAFFENFCLVLFDILVNLVKLVFKYSKIPLFKIQNV